MSTIQQLVTQLGPGWTLVGNGTPIEETTVATVTDPLGVKPPQTINRGSGEYYVVVQDPDGHQRALFLTPNPNSPVLTQNKGPDVPTKVVRQTGVNDTVPDPTSKTGATKPNPDVYSGDLSKIDWNPGKPVGDVPQGSSKTTPTATAKLDRLDSKGNVIPPGDTTTPAVQLRDPATGTTVDVPKDPAGTLTTINNTPMVIKPDGTATAVTGPDGKPITVTKDKQQINVPGIGLVEYDPSKSGTDAYNVIVKTPTGVQAKDLAPQKTGGKIFVPIDDGKGGIVWQEAKDTDGNSLPADTTYTVAAGGNDPRSPTITLIDQQGNTKVIKKDGWTPPPNPQSGTAVTPNTEADQLVTVGDNGQLVFTKNPNKLSISDAQRELAKQLGVQVASGSMTEKAAQDLITNATNAMTAQASQKNAAANMLTAQTGQERLGIDAANNQLSQLNQGAQTGAGLLQNRVTNAMSGFNSALSAMASGKMMNAPAGLGEDLVGGLREWVTGLGGGQPVYDSAAAMVNQAAPGLQSSGDPTLASQAYAALRGAMDLYKSRTGQELNPSPGPFNAPTTSGGPVGAEAGTRGGGAVPVQTNVGVQQNLGAQQQANAVAAGTAGRAPTATLNAQGLMDNPQGRAMAGGQVPVAAGGAPQTPGLYNPAYQQGIVSAVGRPATGPIVGSLQPLPMPVGPWYPGAQPFAAPVTV